jgi:hypothetical protein
MNVFAMSCFLSPSLIWRVSGHVALIYLTKYVLEWEMFSIPTIRHPIFPLDVGRADDEVKFIQYSRLLTFFCISYFWLSCCDISVDGYFNFSIIGLCKEFICNVVVMKPKNCGKSRVGMFEENVKNAKI